MSPCHAGNAYDLDAMNKIIVLLRVEDLTRNHYSVPTTRLDSYQHKYVFSDGHEEIVSDTSTPMSEPYPNVVTR